MIRKDIIFFTVNDICAFLDIYQKCYNKNYRSNPVFDSLSLLPLSQHLLTDQEGGNILKEIAQQQIGKDCLRGQYI